MKRKHKIIIPVAIVAVLVLAICVGIRWKMDYAKTEVLTSVSEDEHYSLTIYMVGEPVMPYGDTSCRFILSEDGKKLNSYDFDVSNDGAIVDEGNFQIVWNENNVAVTVSASEQNSRIYQLMFDGSVSWHE